MSSTTTTSRRRLRSGSIIKPWAYWAEHDSFIDLTPIRWNDLFSASFDSFKELFKGTMFSVAIMYFMWLLVPGFNMPFAFACSCVYVTITAVTALYRIISPAVSGQQNGWPSHFQDNRFPPPPTTYSSSTSSAEHFFVAFQRNFHTIRSRRFWFRSNISELLPNTIISSNRPCKNGTPTRRVS